MFKLRLKMRWVALLAILLIALGYMAYGYFRDYRYEQQLADILAELDKNEPGWDWNHRLKSLPYSAQAENAGEEIKAITRLLAIDEYRNLLGRNAWGIEHDRIHTTPLFQAYMDYVIDHPNVRFPSDFRQVLDALLAATPAPDALERVHRLHQFQSSYFKYNFSPFLLMTLLPDVQPVRALLQVLSWQAEMQLEANQPELAANAISAMLQMNHVFDHDPFSICMLVRAAMLKKSCQTTQRLLAQSSATAPATLLRLQQAFMREEASMSTLPEMFRWERAAYDHDLSHFHSGRYSFKDFLLKYGSTFSGAKSITGNSALDQFLLWISPGFRLEAWARPRHFALERVELLQHYQHIIEWSQLPEYELMDKLEPCLAVNPVLSPFCFVIFTGMNSDLKTYQTAKYNHVHRLAQTHLSYHAHCRGIIAVLAAERYRVENGAWPANWEQLTHGYLSAIPMDPFTGMPLVLKQLPDGIVIYSLGKNRSDEGGAIFPVEKQSDNDIGFRLWNPAQRRVEKSKELQELKENPPPGR